MILLFININRNNKEGFFVNFFENNYQQLNKRDEKITIELKPQLLNPIKVLFNRNFKSQKIIFDKIKQLYPIIYKYTELNWNQQINLVNQQTDLISMMQEDVLFDALYGLKLYSNTSIIQNYPNIDKYYKYNEIKKNLSYISSFFYSHFTLLVPLKYNIYDWSKIKGYTIGTLNSDTSFYNLICILYSLNYQELVKVKTYDKIENLLNAFYKDKIDMLYLSIHHPNKLIDDISKKKNINIVLDAGLDPQKMGFFFPVSFKSSVDISYYKYVNSFNPLKKEYSSFASRVIIITNKNTDTNKIYDMIKIIFKNIEFIKFNQPYLKNISPYFMIFISSLIRYHPGCIQYYKELGYITNNNNLYCTLNPGTGICTMNKIKENNIDIRNYFGNDIINKNKFKKYISNYQIQPKQNQFYPNPIFQQTFNYF